MKQLDGMRIFGPTEGGGPHGTTSRSRELVTAADTGGRWRLGEVRAEPNEAIATHFHPGEPEVIVILDGYPELHGAAGVIELSPGDVVFIPPDTEHGLRTPAGGRWIAIWPQGERVRGPRYAA
jgi:quercetin dioxygenase-like cupin family protein